MTSVAAHRGYDIRISDEVDGVREWSISRSGHPGSTGDAVRSGSFGSFRQAVLAAKATIDATEDW